MSEAHHCLICGEDAYVGVGDQRLRDAAGTQQTMWLCMDHFNAWLKERSQLIDKLREELAQS